MKYLIKLDSKKDIKENKSLLGNKALNLYYLKKNKYKIPLTYVIISNAYIDYKSKPIDLLKDIKDELIEIIDNGKNYAIRSSSSLEDSIDYSYAGQFNSFLNVKGIDEIINCIIKIWDGLDKDKFDSYKDKLQILKGTLSMSIIVQEMVTPILSGVAFSKNPVTGFNQVIIEAVEGACSLLVDSGRTPLRWVYTWGYETENTSDNKYNEIVKKVYSNIIEIERDFKKPVDIEWCYNGYELFFLQVRGITTINNKSSFYSNSISKEFLPGMIKPLIWSINIPIVCGAWKDLICEVTGIKDIEANNLAKSFYYRAYFNMGTIGDIFEYIGMPRQSLELTLGIVEKEKEKKLFKFSFRTLKISPKVIKFLVHNSNLKSFSNEMYSSKFIECKSFMKSLKFLKDYELIAHINTLIKINSEIARLNIIVPLSMNYFNTKFKKELDKLNINIDEINFDYNDRETNFEKRIIILQNIYNSLSKDGKANILDNIENNSFNKNKFIDEFNSFLIDFGHLSDSGNDFSCVPWREQRKNVLNIIINYNKINYTKKIKFEKLNIPFYKKKIINHLFIKAKDYSLCKDKISFLYTYSYGIFRVYFKEIERRLIERNVLENNDDIFYLSYDEIKKLVSGKFTIDIKKQIKDEKKHFQDCINYVLPNIIFGEGSIDSSVFNDSLKLKGIPTSKGYYKGKVRNASSIMDINKIEQGDVLVVPYSDIGLTPLFAKAGAIICASGGMLSHSSIIAREFNIPSIVSVQNCHLLKDDKVVMVNGFTGEINIL